LENYYKRGGEARVGDRNVRKAATSRKEGPGEVEKQEGLLKAYRRGLIENSRFSDSKGEDDSRVRGLSGSAHRE